MTRLTSIKQTTQYTNNKERNQLFILSTECQFCSPFVCRQHDQNQTSGTDTLNHKIPKSWRSQSFNTPNRIHSQIKVLMSRENMYGAIIIVDMVSCWMLLLHHHRIELFIHLWLPPHLLTAFIYIVSSYPALFSVVLRSMECLIFPSIVFVAWFHFILQLQLKNSIQLKQKMNERETTFAGV